MKKNTVLFCTGLSGTGKTYFIKNILPAGVFYNLKSATTRPMRENEMDGREYYFRDEHYFETKKFATYLFVNEQFWKSGVPKWLYGVPEFEIYDHIGQNLTYDVIQPRYVRQMIDWFTARKLDREYNFRILWFQPSETGNAVVQKRQNMPNDLEVRQQNTCNTSDFRNAKLHPNHRVISSSQQLVMDNRLRAFLRSLESTNTK